MKKLFVCLLALMLALPAAGSADWFSDLFGAPASGLTLRYAAVPEAAFSEGNNRVIAASPDSRFVLISNPDALYLWDCQAGKRVPVSFAREEDREALNMIVLNAALNPAGPRMNAEQRAQRMAEQEARRDKYLAGLGLTQFADLDQLADFLPHLGNFGANCVGLDGAMAAVECPYLAIAFSLDLTTGAARLFERGSAILAVGSGMMMAGLRFWDLATAEPVLPDLAAVSDDGRPELSTLPSAAAICADGGVVFLSCAGAFSPEGNDYWCVRADRKANSAFLVGHYAFNRAPNRILLSCEDRWAMLSSRAGALNEPVVLLDLETGKTSTVKAGELLPMAAAKNGFLCWDLKSYDIVLLDPAAGTRTKVSLAPGFDWSGLGYTAVNSVVGNGQGLLFTQQQSLHGYFVLEGE